MDYIRWFTTDDIHKNDVKIKFTALSIDQNGELIIVINREILKTLDEMKEKGIADYIYTINNNEESLSGVQTFKLFWERTNE